MLELGGEGPTYMCGWKSMSSEGASLVAALASVLFSSIISELQRVRLYCGDQTLPGLSHLPLALSEWADVPHAATGLARERLIPSEFHRAVEEHGPQARGGSFSQRSNLFQSHGDSRVIRALEAVAAE